MKVTSIAPTFSARCSPSIVPRETAPRTFGSFSISGISTRPAVSDCSVSGTSILAISSVPGAVMMTAARRCLASMPNAMYAAMMPPDTWAIPLVMTHINSDFVSLFRNGRIVRGASVCPMKMLAATFSDSAPLAPITRVMSQAAPRIMSCITPM